MNKNVVNIFIEKDNSEHIDKLNKIIENAQNEMLKHCGCPLGMDEYANNTKYTPEFLLSKFTREERLNIQELIKEGHSFDSAMEIFNLRKLTLNQAKASLALQEMLDGKHKENSRLRRELCVCMALINENEITPLRNTVEVLENEIKRLKQEVNNCHWLGRKPYDI